MSTLKRQLTILCVLLAASCAAETEEEATGGEDKSPTPKQAPLTNTPPDNDPSSTSQDSEPSEQSMDQELEQDNPYAGQDPVSPDQEFDLGDPVRFNWDDFNRSNGSVFVLIGSSTRCGDDTSVGLGLSMTRQFRSMLADIAAVKNSEPDALIVCYRRKKTYFGAVQSLWTQDYHQGQVDTISPDDLSSKISEFANGRSVSIIGHGMGAGLGMIAASHLVSQPDTTLDFLVTLDPISPFECKRIFDRDCISTPEEVSLSQRQQIADNTDGWLHFYQRITRVMMSDDIPEANERKKRALIHGKMDTDSEIWDTIRDRIIPQG